MEKPNSKHKARISVGGKKKKKTDNVAPFEVTHSCFRGKHE